MPRKSPLQEPSPAQWRALYDAARQFSELKPWLWMSDADLFAVEDPAGGETGYCCVLGQMEQVFALVVYLGPEGLQAYLDLQSGRTDESDPDMAYSQKALMLSLENREDLEPRDRQTIKGLNLKFRGRHAWPQFKSYLPGYVPWHLTYRQAGFLTLAVEQSIDVAGRFKEDPQLLGIGIGDSVLTRVPRKSGDSLTWSDAWIPLPSLEKPPLEVPDVEPGRLEPLKGSPQKRGQAWEIEGFHFPGGVHDAERPYYPKVGLVMDHALGTALHFWLKPPWEFSSTLQEQMLDFLEQCNALPGRFLVRRKELLELLQPIASALGITLVFMSSLPHAEAFRKSMWEAASQGMLGKL